MATLTIPELVSLARAAGFQGDDAATAAAVAMAESSGRTDADNPVSSATGLWQIMQSVHVKAHPTWSVAWLENPQNNARAAYIVSNGGKNWKPWVAYTSGAYLRFLPAARRAARSGGSPVGTGGTSSTGGSSFDPSVWLRIAMFLGGAVLLLIAIVGATKLGRYARKALPV